MLKQKGIMNINKKKYPPAYIVILFNMVMLFPFAYLGDLIVETWPKPTWVSMCLMINLIILWVMMVVYSIGRIRNL